MVQIRHLLLSALLLLSGSTPAVAAPVDYGKVVVQVDCDDGLGSAVKIGVDKYITAAHVVNNGECHIRGETISDVVLSKDSDFAVFTGPASRDKLRVSCSGFYDGETYLSVGYAFGWRKLTYEPLIASKYVINGYQAFTGEIIPGMSGGAVIDSRGRVVGINNMRWPARSLALKNTELC